MKACSSGLKSHIASECTTLATCAQIVRQDGLTLAFTEHDQPLTIGGIVFSPLYSFERTSIRTAAQLGVDQVELDGILAAAGINAYDVRGRRYDGAVIYVFVVNWSDLTQGIIRIRKARTGDLTLREFGYHGEVRGLMQYLQTTIGQLYSPSCRADLFDAQCGLDATAFAQTSTVSAVINNQHFSVGGFTIPTITTTTTNAFANATITWTSGANAGMSNVVFYSSEITADNSAYGQGLYGDGVYGGSAPGELLNLINNSSSPIAIGDTFTLQLGDLVETGTVVRSEEHTS